MTIYFAASISGGRGDQAIYEQIIEMLKQPGTVKRVICPHRPSTERRLSGMIAGCGGILVRTYTDTAQLPSILKEALAIS